MKDSDFQLNDDEDDEDEETWETEGDWNNDGDEVEGDVRDESAAYLEFLNEEVQRPPGLITTPLTRFIGSEVWGGQRSRG